MEVRTLHDKVGEFWVDVDSKEPTYLMINTSDYFSGDTKSGVAIVSGRDLGEYGWEDINSLNMEIGEVIVSDDYGSSAQIIRLS